MTFDRPLYLDSRIQISIQYDNNSPCTRGSFKLHFGPNTFNKVLREYNYSSSRLLNGSKYRDRKTGKIRNLEE
jgi:hypothetical protein